MIQTIRDRYLTYRVTVAVVGFWGFPTVGIPLFLPWPNDDELRGIMVCLFVIDDDGVIWSADAYVDVWGNRVRLCGPTWDRTGAVNGLLLTSWSKPFSFDENALPVNSLTGFVPFRWTDDGAGWTLRLFI